MDQCTGCCNTGTSEKIVALSEFLYPFVFVTYLGGSGHKPRWIAAGIVLLGAGSLIFSIPHFVTEPYEAGAEADNLCNLHNNATSESCATDVPSSGELSDFFYVFLFGQLVLLILNVVSIPSDITITIHCNLVLQGLL